MSEGDSIRKREEICVEQKWRITVWGVRGSAPRPEAGYLEYGGNTACISLEWNDELVILDAGSGLSVLGRRFLEGPGFRRIHILLSHLHLDHVIGLVQFPLFYRPEVEAHLYGSSGLRQKLETLVGPPWWPVGFEGFRAKAEFHELCPGQRFALEGLSGLKGCTIQGNHPGGSLLYRLEEYQDKDGNGYLSKKSLVYGLDCEINEDIFSAYAAFAKGSSLLIWDAGFTKEDLRPGWGHSTWDQGIAMRQAAGVGKVLMTHYNWEYSDIFLRQQEELAGRRDPACVFGKEGMVIVL